MSRAGGSRRIPAARTSPRARGSKTGKVYDLSIVLRDVTPRVWRHVRVSGSTSLQRLHEVIQTVMGWQDYHVHEFTFGDRILGRCDIWHEGRSLLFISSIATTIPFFGIAWRHSAFDSTTICLRALCAAGCKAALTIHSRGTRLFAIFKQTSGAGPLNSGVRPETFGAVVDES